MIEETRKGIFHRKTRETDISIEIIPDMNSLMEIDSSIPFLDHLLHGMAFHGGFGMKLKGSGDLAIDAHHLVEDTGIVLGEAFLRLVPEKGAIGRFGHAVIPMDDALSEVAVDVCGRPYLCYKAEFPQPLAGSFDIALLKEFFQGFITHAKINLHIRVLYGENSHHMAESMFKALGKSLQKAYVLKNNTDQISTKGTIT